MTSQVIKAAIADAVRQVGRGPLTALPMVADADASRGARARPAPSKWSIQHVCQTRRAQRTKSSSKINPKWSIQHAWAHHRAEWTRNNPVAHPSRCRNHMLDQSMWQMDEMKDAAPGNQAQPGGPHRPLEHAKASGETQGTDPGGVPEPVPCVCRYENQAQYQAEIRMSEAR